MMAGIWQVSRIPVAAQRVSLVRTAGPTSGEGTSFFGEDGWTYVPDDLAGRLGPHYDSKDFINTTLAIRAMAKTFYLDFQDLLDAGWAKLTSYNLRSDEPVAHLNLDQIGWIANTAHTFIACEFDRVLSGMRLHVRTSGPNAPGPAAANGYAVVGLKVAQTKCPEGIKRK
jgi:hypothetical protein